MEISTFKNVLIFIKTKVRAIFKLMTCGLLDQRYTHWATEIDTQYWWHKQFHNELKSPCYDKLNLQGVEDPLCSTTNTHLYIKFFNSNVCAFCSNTSKNKIKPMKSFVTNQKIYICVCACIFKAFFFRFAVGNALDPNTSMSNVNVPCIPLQKKIMARTMYFFFYLSMYKPLLFTIV